MKFVSTKGNSPTCSFNEAISQGLAPDGGLYIPESFPSIRRLDINATYPHFAAKVLNEFTFLKGHTTNTVNNAFTFPIPLVDLGEDTSVLELYHGPTLSFKDIGARFLANWLKPKNNSIVLVATSGDTGGAVAAAFHKKPNINAYILYPKDKISKRQEVQLNTLGNNVKAFSVLGDFDDCQRIVKEAFSRQITPNLISANSVNIGRLLPQVTYYAYTATQIYHKYNKLAAFIVPSGNLGNATAALWAKKMGFPIGDVVFAVNANKTLHKYVRTGEWVPNKSVQTLASAMDVGNPSNAERIFSLNYKYSDLTVISVSDAYIKETQAARPWGRDWCPHTATAIWALPMAKARTNSYHWVIVATAHPSKFDNSIDPPLSLKLMLDKQGTSIDIEPTLEALTKEMK